MDALVPPEALAQVRGRLDALADDILAAARAARPEYDEALAGPDGLAIRLGIEQSLHELLRRLEAPGRASEEAREAWLLLGEREFQAGRSLEALQAAFRAGTRAAVRRAADLAADAGVAATSVALLAEEVFVLVDELASAVIEGYVRAQSDEAGERDRARSRLASLLLEGADGAVVARAAERARWTVPASVAALAVDTDAPDRVAGRLGADALAGADAGGAWVLVPSPDRLPSPNLTQT